MHRNVICFGLVVLGAAFAGRANAQCGSGAARQAPFAPLVSLAGPGLSEALPTRPLAAADDSAASIVGLWHVTFQQLSPGPPAFFDEGYDQFHSDGTEILNDIPAPVTGNVCLGVFVKTGARSYKLHHVYWNFDANGAVIGRGTWDSEITLDKSGNSYTGTWTIKNYTPAGVVLLPVLSGNLSALRIWVQ